MVVNQEALKWLMHHCVDGPQLIPIRLPADTTFQWVVVDADVEHGVLHLQVANEVDLAEFDRDELVDDFEKTLWFLVPSVALQQAGIM